MKGGGRGESDREIERESERVGVSWWENGEEEEEEGESRSRYSDGRSSPGSCEVKSLPWF